MGGTDGYAMLLDRVKAGQYPMELMPSATESWNVTDVKIINDVYMAKRNDPVITLRACKTLSTIVEEGMLLGGAIWVVTSLAVGQETVIPTILRLNADNPTLNKLGLGILLSGLSCNVPEVQEVLHENQMKPNANPDPNLEPNPDWRSSCNRTRLVWHTSQ